MKKNRVGRLDRLQVIWSVGIIIVSIFSAWAVLHLIRVLPKESFEQKIIGSITRQGDWFVRNQTTAGDFVYERYAATGEVKEGNNIVRQAGALYGLAQLYSYTKDPAIAQTLEKGFGYFRTLTATPSAETNAITYNEETQTNTTALLVLALVEYLEADAQHKTTENLEYLVRLSNYLVSTQEASGAYINEYVPKPVESDYNNGETMYALIRSYNVTQKEPYLISVKRMAAYAIDHYGTQGFNSSFFSWGMAGFAHLYVIDANEAYWEFLKGYADKYMGARGSAYEQYLAHTSEDVITPGASVFLEGVDHIAWIAKDKDIMLHRTLTRHVQNMLNFLLMYELDSPNGKYASGNDLVRGAVCSQVGCETTRIDFLQHNMSASLLYLRLLR
ncbi:MAG: hypothetical protein AAB542_01430 [Patescibacteria group bacterium]